MTTTDAKLNRQLFQISIGKKEWTAKEFHERWISKYGFTIKYNNFMELINNNVSWKLVYALAIADMLGVDINEIFEFTSDEFEKIN
jgi:hypothetical protein